MFKKLKKKKIPWDFPGGPVVKNLPSNAGNMGSIPGQGTKISHAGGQLSPRAATTEPAHSRARTQLDRSLRTATKDPHATTKILYATTKTRCSLFN